MRRSPADPERLAATVRTGDRAALGQALTLVESSLERDRRSAEDLLDVLDSAMEEEPDALRLGFTGPPGVGKSTLIEAFGLHLIEGGARVAVLAVDPSSRVSGGSILGDKTRMGRLSVRDEAFVRPSPSRGTLGGVTARTREMIMVLEAGGFDWVFVESVGVGQSEAAISDLVDLTVLLTLPGAGDELQGIKRGILEHADVIVVNKADGERLAAARDAAGQLRAAFRFMGSSTGFEAPEVLLASAVEGEGLEDLERVCRRFGDGGEGWSIAERRRAQQVRWFEELVRSEVERRLTEALEAEGGLPALRAEVAAGHIRPWRGARQALTRFFHRLAEAEPGTRASASEGRSS